MTLTAPENSKALTLRGRPMSAPLHDVDMLSDQLVAHYASVLPAYSDYQMTRIQGLLRAATMRGLEMSIKLLDAGLPPTEEDLQGIRALAAGEAKEGTPLDAVLSVANEALTMVQDLIVADADTDDFADVQEGARRFFAMAQMLHTAISTSYAEALRPGTAGADGAATHSLVHTLLTGNNPDLVAQQLGVELAPEYLVLRVALNLQPGGPGSGKLSALEVRRKLDLLRTAFVDRCGSPFLSSLTHRGGAILLPGTPAWDWVADMLRAVGEAAGVEITAAAENSRRQDIPATTERVDELLRLARRLGRAPGLYGLGDLAVEYQLTRPGPARADLVRLLDPLESSPELLQTLTIHIRNDLNRQRTASMLHLHTNTVDYRMKRIAQLTGLDPTRPSGLRQLQAAIVAREFTRAGTPAQS
ncbi:PucR family transcriptional regulator [Rhodococcus sp. D2-41]|uniref:Helix-turn-helix domain-containing protein n=1 Tax=Speluncibacter jeojiensis TaxID=2710754 RepID=A0A9X4M235_9ACTN|nr:helix-turn-helix domain-containing protein [Rhodococcus sp. D2-41]MDG3009053.1 PucR family transcriptional regulator [Rhodococcus sp. D2-41]MDG3015565.1 helix-turn-helix domain-containing protein [Corynebacteriales bacterium D3-21]